MIKKEIRKGKKWCAKIEKQRKRRKIKKKLKKIKKVEKVDAKQLDLNFVS